MAKSAKCNIRAMHSWWAIKSYNHDVFVGCDSVMVLSKQLGVTDNQLDKALKGTGTKVSEAKLRNTFPGAFKFRGYGRARCLTVLKANGVGQWLDIAKAVPTKDTIVKEHDTQANELKNAIMSSKANTRSRISSLESTITITIVTPDIAGSSTEQKRELPSDTFGVPASKKAKTVGPNGKECMKAAVSDLAIIDIFKTAFALSETELSVSHIQRLDDQLSVLEIPEATVCNRNETTPCVLGESMAQSLPKERNIHQVSSP
jgi:hypothetical protein